MAGRRRRKRGVEVNEDDDESGQLLSDLLWLGINIHLDSTHCIHNNHCMKSRLGITCAVHKMSIILQYLNISLILKLWFTKCKDLY